MIQSFWVKTILLASLTKTYSACKVLCSLWRAFQRSKATMLNVFREKELITVLYIVSSSLARGSTPPADSTCTLGRGFPCLARSFVVSPSPSTSCALLGCNSAASATSGPASLGGLSSFAGFWSALLGDFLHRFPAPAPWFWARTRSGASSLGAWPWARSWPGSWAGSWAGSGSLYFEFKRSATFDEGFRFHSAFQGEPQLQGRNVFRSSLRFKVGQDRLGAWSLAVFQRCNGFYDHRSCKRGFFSSLPTRCSPLPGDCFSGTSASFGHFRTVGVNFLTELKSTRLLSSVASGKWLNSSGKRHRHNCQLIN